MRCNPSASSRGANSALVALTGAILLSALSGLAHAAPPAVPAPPDPLSGPSVTDHSVPGAPSRFSDPSTRANPGDKKGRAVPHEVFANAVRSLDTPDADESIRLTSEQSRAFRALERDFRTKMDAFRREHRSEFEAIRAGADQKNKGAKGKQTAKPAAAAPNAPATSPDAGETPAMRERLEKLRSQGPSPVEVQTKVFEMLNPAQREAVEKQLKSFRDEQIEKQARGKAKDQIAKRDAKRAAKGKAGAGAGGTGGTGGAGEAADIPAAMRERYENATPEQREQMRKRLQERRAQKSGEGAASAPPQSPPGTDGVNIPPPDVKPGA